MNARFFIERPVLAAVLSLAILLAGLVAVRNLPVEQYPEILPPQIVVYATYPGASAEAVAQTVAPLEQQINGVDNMLYMQSTTSDSGTLQLTVTFKIGTDPDKASMNVHDRVQLATPLLPPDVTRLGVTVSKQSTSILAIVALSSPGERYDSIYVGNYALLNVIDTLKRVPGVGDAKLFGAKDYAMRIWLKPDKLAQYNLTPNDVAAAVQEQNAQYAAGGFGQEPTGPNLTFTYAAMTKGRLPDATAFGNIILRTNTNGASLKLKDVARVDLGALDYSIDSTLNGAPAVPIAIFLQSGANALETLAAVEARMKELAQKFPDGIVYSIPYDTTRFVRASIKELVVTFAQALLLVVLVVFLFLQNLRAVLIPIIAVPVSIIGTFAGMYALGFSINLLTLFGLVLAIGIVVDDAIVVLENVERLMASEKLSPKDAAIRAMAEVTGPIIAIVLVLCAVFMSIAFMGGLAGQMYRQFAVTIAVSVVISGLVALTLTPALCALILKPGGHEPRAPLRSFNRLFERASNGYVSGASFFLKRAVVGVTVVLGMLAATASLYTRVPNGMLPDEDQGVLLTMAMLPSAASLNRTREVMAKEEEILRRNPAVADVVSLAGFDIASGGSKSSAGVSFVTLVDWSKRQGRGQDAQSLAGIFVGMLSGIREALVFAFNPPPINGLSNTGGFELYVQDRSGAGMAALAAATEKLVAAALVKPELAGVRTTLDMNVPQYRLDLDRDKAKALGVSLTEIFSAMQSTFGSLYINDFTLYGRNYKVVQQSEAAFRQRPAELDQVFVRSTTGKMVALSVFLRAERIVGPDQLDRFNAFPAAKIMGNAGRGYSSGQAIAAMQDIAKTALPAGYEIGWSGAAYQEIDNASSGSSALLLGIVATFLILAAQYGRWSLPLAVVLAVPFACFGAFLAVWLRGLENDVYFQVGLVVLIGLSAKNAILIVEFAAKKQKQGLSAADAAIQAARLRFRPIVMTSLAFILGCVPLAVSTGAGSAARHSIGTGVIGGTLAATVLAVFFVPMFFGLIARWTKPAEAGAATAGVGADRS
jgi:multidrug efflux pump